MSATDKKLEIPDGWNLDKIGNQYFVQGGFAFRSRDYSDDGVPLVRISNVGKGYFDYKDVVYLPFKMFAKSRNFQLTKGDVLIGLTGDLGKICKIEEDFLPLLLNQRVGRFIPKTNANRDFLYYLINTSYFINKLSLFFAGGAQANISPKQIEDIEVLFPPNNEQQELAEILSTVDEGIEKTDQIIEKYKRVKQGLMQDLFGYGIDEKGNIRSEKTHKFKDSPLGRIPEEWEVISLGKKCAEGGGSIQTGPFGSQLHARDYKEEGVPIITVEHLSERKILHHNLPLVGEADYERLNKYILQFGDLVFSRVGAIDRCSFTSEEEEGWLFSGRCLRVRPGSLFDSTFLSYLLNYTSSRQWILNNSVGSTMHCLNTSILFNLPVIFPPTTEQSTIAMALASADATIEEEDNYKQKLLALKRGLMEDLLSGAVRVNHLIKE